MKKILMGIIIGALIAFAVVTIKGTIKTVTVRTDYGNMVTVGATGYHEIDYKKSSQDDVLKQIKEIEKEVRKYCGHEVYLYDGIFDEDAGVFNYYFKDLETGWTYIEQVDVGLLARFLMG